MAQDQVKTSLLNVPVPSREHQAQSATAQLTPDVELIVDGFGFMPKTPPPSEASLKEEESRSRTCTSSSNIDIVRRYTWKTKNRMTVQVISYGATITTIHAPDRKGVPDDVIAGFDTLEDYMNKRNPYMGATIGRYAGMIRDATIIVRPSGKEYALCANRGDHHYNGGFVGFDKVNWYSYKKGNQVIMSHLSERHNEGYPAALMTQVIFEVKCDNTIVIEMKCTANEPTIVNLSNSQYFNLAGHHAGQDAAFEHIVTINADKYTPTDEEGVVLGEKKVVGGSAYDFRVPRVLGVMIPKMCMGGYNINYCITQGQEQDLTFHARAIHPQTGRVLEVYSNQPGMQFYTGSLLPDPDKIIQQEATDRGGDESGKGEGESESGNTQGEEEEPEGLPRCGYVPLYGKKGTCYKRNGFVCFMPQNYPDAVNHRNFPNSILNPGEVYCHRIQYKFGILLGKYS